MRDFCPGTRQICVPTIDFVPVRIAEHDCVRREHDSTGTPLAGVGWSVGTLLPYHLEKGDDMTTHPAIRLLGAAFLLVSVATATQAQTCPAANPNDDTPDDIALNACIAAGGTVVLENGRPGYIIASGLVLSTNGVTMTSNGTSISTAAYIIADPSLRAPVLRVADGTSGYTISNLIFEGNRLERWYITDCTAGYDPRTHGYNLLIRGNSFLIDNVWSLGAMCGSAMEVYGSGFEIRNNHINYNGFAQGESYADTWSDGITLLRCDNSSIHNNELTDNTDVDLIVGPSTNCNVYSNTVTHSIRYGFAGLMVGFGGDHSGSTLSGNGVSSSVDQLAFGVMVGHHPWDLQVQTSHAGAVTGNTASGSVVPVAIDGIDAGSVTGNSASGARGTRGFSCSYAANYTAFDFGSAGIQSGYYPRWYHNGACNP